MIRFLTILLCVLYTAVATGGSVYLHNCCGGTLISLYEKNAVEACSFCAGTANPEEDAAEHKTCMEGKCGHVEIKVDQLEDQLFASQTNTTVVFSPVILTRLWVLLTPVLFDIHKDEIPFSNRFVYNDTSPATYLVNCIFRI